MSARSVVLTAVLVTAGVAVAQNPTTNQNQTNQATRPPKAPGQLSNANAEPTPAPQGTPGFVADPTNSNGALAWDKQFIMNIALRGMRQIELAKIAVDKTSNAAIKEYAANVVEEQTKATGALKRIAGKQSIAIPAALDPKEQTEVDRIAKLSGDDFDRAYARDQVKTHERSLRDFQREAKDGQDETVKAFAVHVLPIVERHLQSARDLTKPVISTR
jgi:putative membrane protein